MNRILGTITTLDQHFVELANGGDVYRPENCPYCQVGGLWHHGCYHRKADRSADTSESRNPVAILRFLCNACLHCAAALVRLGHVASRAATVAGRRIPAPGLPPDRYARSTARRWQDWLHARSAQFTFFLRSRLPELGRLPEPDFWLQVIASMSLTDAMTQLDQDLVVP